MHCVTVFCRCSKVLNAANNDVSRQLIFWLRLYNEEGRKTACQLVNRKADFFYTTNRFESIRMNESNPIANWNALIGGGLTVAWCSEHLAYHIVENSSVTEIHQLDVGVKTHSCTETPPVAHLSTHKHNRTPSRFCPPVGQNYYCFAFASVL